MLTQLTLPEHLATLRSIVFARDYTHTCAKDIHYPHLVARGFVCGGRPPAQSMAITMAVCLLQVVVLGKPVSCQELVGIFVCTP